MAHDKHSTWNRQRWHPQKSHASQKLYTLPKYTQREFVKDWGEWFLKGNS